MKFCKKFVKKVSYFCLNIIQHTQAKNETLDFQKRNCAHIFLLNFIFWSRYYSKHFWKPQFWNLRRPCTLLVLCTTNIIKPFLILYQISKFLLNFALAILSATTLPQLWYTLHAGSKLMGSRGVNGGAPPPTPTPPILEEQKDPRLSARHSNTCPLPVLGSYLRPWVV